MYQSEEYYIGKAMWLLSAWNFAMCGLNVIDSEESVRELAGELKRIEEAGIE